jgi:hypothetical protein
MGKDLVDVGGQFRMNDVTIQPCLAVLKLKPCLLFKHLFGVSMPSTIKARDVVLLEECGWELGKSCDFPVGHQQRMARDPAKIPHLFTEHYEYHTGMDIA